MLKRLYSQEIQEKKKDLQNHSQAIKKMARGTYISTITLNVNRLNAPPKDRLAKWIQKQDAYICCLKWQPTPVLLPGKFHAGGAW